MNIQNELGVIVVFAQACQQYGWKINHIQSEFPDAIIQDKDGETYRAEFEFCSSNFKAHRHDLFQCDVIICWDDDWDDCPLTVWSMKSWDDQTITIRDRKDLMIASLAIENEQLKRQMRKLEIEIEKNDRKQNESFHCEHCEFVAETQNGLNAHKRVHAVKAGNGRHKQPTKAEVIE